VSGLKVKRIVWTIVFLGVTLFAIVMEVVAGVFHPAGTIPWTEYLAQYVPWPIQLVAYVALAVWLPFHFWRHDHMRKIAYDKGMQHGLAATAPSLGLATTKQLLDEIKARGETEVYYRDLGNDMAIAAAALVEKLPGSMLGYRTFHGR
jgi:hypothetical protein